MGKTTHGLTNRSGIHPLYPIWSSMKQRCYNPNNHAFYRYGGRGITVCDKWYNSFPAFLGDMGDRPKNYTLERMDNNKGYGPNNCKWATRSEQSKNTNPRYSYFTPEQTKTSKAAHKKACKINSEKRKNPPKICDFCGNGFFRQGHTKNPPKYCSRKCYFEAKRIYNIKKFTKECLNCNKEFIPKRNKAKAKYCCMKCSYNHLGKINSR